MSSMTRLVSMMQADRPGFGRIKAEPAGGSVMWKRVRPSEKHQGATGRPSPVEGSQRTGWVSPVRDTSASWILKVGLTRT
jgi:hypothetical protein